MTGEKLVTSDHSERSTGDELKRLAVRFAGLGTVAGTLSGLFGVGGGFLIVPGLRRFGLSTRAASATSLMAVIPIATAALIPYAIDGNVQPVVAALLVVGGLVGTALGTRLLNVLPVRTIRVCFAVLLVAAAAKLLVTVTEGELADFSFTVDAELVALGMATGVLSGLLGVGGGFVMVPGMMLIASMPSAPARGTSLAAILPTALYGTWRNRQAGLVETRQAMTIGGAGALASAAIAVVAGGLNTRVSNIAFAVLLIVLAITMLRDRSTQ
jgi:uncharacterized protein